MAKRYTGFPAFGVDDPDVILEGSCKSVSDLPAGTSVVGNGSGVEEYDSQRGLKLNHIDARFVYSILNPLGN